MHRDIKPQNIIISQAGSPKRRLKLIDMGAAADLRVGINYAPNEFLLDPRYAPAPAVHHVHADPQVRSNPF